ncbi:hypothetical protein Ancab_030352 [Ancistrocladus abbreviatus]
MREVPAAKSRVSLWESSGAGTVLLPKLSSDLAKSSGVRKVERPVFTIEPKEEGKREEVLVDDCGFGKFLEACYDCKKISETDDVHKYRTSCFSKTCHLAKEEKEEKFSDLIVSEESLKFNSSQKNRRQILPSIDQH